jgi:hypothetical protein
VARWINIAPGADGRFTVRAQHHPDANGGYKSYAFSVFRLDQIDAAAWQYSLTVNVTGLGAVQRTPDRPLYAAGERVQLLAVPDDDWAFVQWTGACTGYANPDTVTMTGNMTVGAQFSLTTGVDDGGAPLAFALRAGSANPAGRSVRLRYELPHEAHVTLRVYDMRGRRVADLVDAVAPLGRHQVEWITDGVASGVYYCRFEAPGFRTVRKIVVLK